VVPANEIDIGVQERIISNHQPVCGSSSLLWDVKSGVEPAIHSLMEGCMSAYYLQLRLDCLYWFTFLSRMALLRSALCAISKLATGLINETLTDVFRLARTSHKWSIALPTEGLQSFTVFCENFMNLPPTNELLLKFRNVDGGHIEGGDVLLIKHPLRDVHHIENMTHADLTCAGKLLQWCARTQQCVAITDDYLASRALRTKQYWI